MDSLVDNVTGYIEARIELMRIEIKEEIARGLAKAIVTIVMIAVFTLFVLLISIAAAHKVGESIGMFGGYGVVASFYLLLGLLVFLFRNPITEKLEKRLEERMKKKK
jgi:sorbitol-specific phosphotransferase system component IIC